MPKKIKAEESVQQRVDAMTASMKDKAFTRTVGRRKSAVSRVRLYTGGTGGFVVNDKTIEVYFPWKEYMDIAAAPLKEAGGAKDFDVSIKVVGGGLKSQALSICHGLSRALVAIQPELKPRLRKLGFMTRDPRVKERKKPGLKRARRAPQWQKR